MRIQAVSGRMLRVTLWLLSFALSWQGSTCLAQQPFNISVEAVTPVDSGSSCTTCDLFGWKVTQSGVPSFSPRRPIVFSAMLPRQAVFENASWSYLGAGGNVTGSCTATPSTFISCSLPDPALWTEIVLNVRARYLTARPAPGSILVGGSAASEEAEGNRDDNFALGNPHIELVSVGGVWTSALGGAPPLPVCIGQGPTGAPFSLPMKICGFGFTPGAPTTVTLDGVPATGVVAVSDTLITFNAHRRATPSSGPGSIEVTNNGKSITTPGAIEYVVRGDSNGNGAVTGADTFHLQMYVYLGGPPPAVRCQGDANHNGGVTGADVAFLNLYTYLGGDAPYDLPIVAAPDCTTIPIGARPHELVVGPKDYIGVGSAEASPGQTVSVPIYFRDLPNTGLDADKQRGIGFVGARINFSEDAVESSTITKTGVCAAVTELRDFFETKPGAAAFYVHVDERRGRLPVALHQSGPGAECARLTLKLRRTAPKGRLQLKLDSGPTGFVSFDARESELARDGRVDLEDGYIDIK